MMLLGRIWFILAAVLLAYQAQASAEPEGSSFNGYETLQSFLEKTALVLEEMEVQLDSSVTPGREIPSKRGLLIEELPEYSETSEKQSELTVELEPQFKVPESLPIEHKTPHSPEPLHDEQYFEVSKAQIGPVRKLKQQARVVEEKQSANELGEVEAEASGSKLIRSLRASLDEGSKVISEQTSSETMPKVMSEQPQPKIIREASDLLPLTAEIPTPISKPDHVFNTLANSPYKHEHTPISSANELISEKGAHIDPSYFFEGETLPKEYAEGYLYGLESAYKENQKSGFPTVRDINLLICLLSATANVLQYFDCAMGK